jgi:hypothetical protein
MKYETLMKLREQGPEALQRALEREEAGTLLDGLDQQMAVIDAVATLLNFVTPGDLHSESAKLLDESSISQGLSSILSACTSEIRIDVNRFRRNYLSQDGEGITVIGNDPDLA